jgi:ABC-type nitrate/sulfonate/bicarbonate transport system substrate-binding protein
MRPPIGVTALAAGEVDYTGSTGVSLRAAMKGLPVRALIFIQTRLSFSLIGQPGMTPAKIRNVAVSGIGSLAHYGAQTVLKRLGRDGPGDKINYIATNTTANSYAALTGKAADAVILTAPYTSMATLAGYVDLGDTFDVRDVQGGLVGRMSHIQNHREQIKAVLRAVLRSNEMILKNDEQNVAADSYRQIKRVLNADGDIEEPVLKSILDKIRQESGIAAEIPVDRLVDLSMLREAKAELRKR